MWFPILAVALLFVAQSLYADEKTPHWKTDDWLFNVISKNIDVSGKLNTSATDLPDLERESNKIHFASGFLDSAFRADNSEDAQKRVTQLAKLLGSIVQTGNKTDKAEFYREVVSHEGVIGILDSFLEELLCSISIFPPKTLRNTIFTYMSIHNNHSDTNP